MRVALVNAIEARKACNLGDEAVDGDPVLKQYGLQQSPRLLEHSAGDSKAVGGREKVEQATEGQGVLRIARGGHSLVLFPHWHLDAHSLRGNDPLTRTGSSGL